MGRIKPFHISGKPFGTKMLTHTQIEEIKEKYPFVINKDLCEEYKVSKHVIVELAFHYSLKKDSESYRNTRGWKTNDDPVDLVMFDWFYPKTTGNQMREVFGKSENSITDLANQRGLKKYDDVLSARYSKSNPRILYSVSGEHYEGSDIDLEGVKYIIKNFATETKKSIVDRLRCKLGTVTSVAKYYELTKDLDSVKKRHSEILTERNKRLGRDITPELVRQEAIKYNSKREFYYKDPSLYSAANRLGIMEEVSEHMVTIAFSIPQIISRQITEYLFKQKCEYDTRKIISPYELDVYFPELKIAFEYDGKGWHQNDQVDKVKLCEEKGIYLITLFERSRKFKEDIQKHLIENLKEINSWCGTEITKEQILLFDEPVDFPKLFSDEELELLRGNEVAYLRKNHLNLYNRYTKYNPDNIDFKKSYKDVTRWDEESVIKEINKYTSKGELLKDNAGCYQVIYKKYRHLLPLYGKPHKIRVLCVDTGEEFESITQASKKLGITHSCISKVCTGERERTHNKKFKYINN